MTVDELIETVDALRYRDCRFAVIVEHGIPFLRFEFFAEDTHTREMAEQYGRKWRLSTHMTRSEVVLTALKAVLTASEHEVREEFLYRGVAVCGPHLDVDVLHHVITTLPAANGQRPDLRVTDTDSP